LENVAYSNLPEIFVNDLSQRSLSRLRIPLKEKVLKAGEGDEIERLARSSPDFICGKAEDGRG
jgi:hypothetical protein